jgi:hypothetical protein
MSPDPAGAQNHSLEQPEKIQAFCEQGGGVQCGHYRNVSVIDDDHACAKGRIDLLKEKNIRNQYIVMVGGAPVTEDWARTIGADGYAKTAEEGVNLAMDLISKKKK